MDITRLHELSDRELELQRLNQYNILELTVTYEEILVRERGLRAVEEIRNEALDKLIIIYKILKERHDTDSHTK